MSLPTAGSIATHIVGLFNNIPEGVSGAMVEIVSANVTAVKNYVGDDSISSDSIPEKYQPPIINYSKADVLNMVNSQTGAGAISLSELNISDSGKQMSADQYKMLAESQLKGIGRKIRFARSLS